MTGRKLAIEVAGSLSRVSMLMMEEELKNAGSQHNPIKYYPEDLITKLLALETVLIEFNRGLDRDYKKLKERKKKK